MPNLQTFPQTVYPLAGDVASQNGDPDVTVIGIQQTPVVPQKPTNGQILIYDQPVQAYVPGDPIVSGPDAPGTPSTSNPVQVGGTDGVLVREVRTDPEGDLVVSDQLGIGVLLQQILVELRGIKYAILNLDVTSLDRDFEPDNFRDVIQGQ